MSRKVTFPSRDVYSILEQYQKGASLLDVAATYSVNHRTIRRIILDNGGTIRCAGAKFHTVDATYFHSIDTEEKAYWLGFLLADGCVHGGKIQIALQARDKDHLHKFARSVQSDAPVYYPASDSVRIDIYSAEMCRDLARWNVVPRKSLIATPPQLDSHLQHHFWRGCFDGDGCIHVRATGCGVSLVGSLDTIMQFREFVRKIVPTTAKIWHQRGCYSIRINGTQKPRQVLAVMYNGCTVALDRKLALFHQILDTPSKKKSRLSDSYHP